MNSRIPFILVCVVLVGSFVLAAISPTLQALLLDNEALVPVESTLEPTATVAPIGPYSEYAPVIFDTASTPVIQPTPTATLEGEPTHTVAPLPTVPPDETETPPPTETATATPTVVASEEPG